MRKDEIALQILNMLLDKYERSSSFRGGKRRIILTPRTDMNLFLLLESPADRKPFMDDSAFTEPKSDWDEKDNFEKQKEPDFPASNGIQEEKAQADRLYPIQWVTKEHPSRGTLYPCDSNTEDNTDPLERVKKLRSEKVTGRKTVSQFSDLLFVTESFSGSTESEDSVCNMPLAILQIQRNRGSPE